MSGKPSRTVTWCAGRGSSRVLRARTPTASPRKSTPCSPSTRYCAPP
jgi:hypothetical protein